MADEVAFAHIPSTSVEYSYVSGDLLGIFLPFETHTPTALMSLFINKKKKGAFDIPKMMYRIGISVWHASATFVPDPDIPPVNL